jgi:hypothetical protein
MADLRTRFIEDYAGGLLNISRQELSSTGEVLAQDGFVEGTSLFVEDGRGVKSGLRLGTSLAECIDPVTEIGILNVRTADRTYAKIRDLKSFATAVASAQGALSDTVSETITNLESAFDSLESDVETYRTQLSELIDNTDLGVGNLTERVNVVDREILRIDSEAESLTDRVTSIETTLSQVQVVTAEKQVSGSTTILADGDAGTVNIKSSQYYAIKEIRTNVPAWVTIYTDSVSRGSEQRTEGQPAAVNSGVVIDVVTEPTVLAKKSLPLVSGYSIDDSMYIRAVNKAGSPVAVTVTVLYIPL